MIANLQITHVHLHLKAIVNKEEAWYENLIWDETFEYFLSLGSIQYLHK